ncbi:Uncharacterised protein [Candidatus Gugararchaeum adminiculabundum]|nr:Uncharacterised protein [Candidatus Gugararchaeum adminiculabundum]
MGAQAYSAQELVAKTNELLDSVAPDAPVKELEENVRELRDLRDQMLFHGFNAPFSALIASTRADYSENEPDELQDRAKQIKVLRDLVNAKKFSLARVRISIASHLIALSILTGGKTDIGKEILPHLPLDGNHIRALAQGGEDGVYAYKHLTDAISPVGSDDVVEATVLYEKDGKVEKAKFKLHNPKALEERVAKVYGPTAKVVSSRVSKEQSYLVQKKSSRIALCVAYSALASKLIREQMDAVPKVEKVQKYAAILKKKGFKWYARADHFDESQEELKDEMVGAGLLKYVEGSYILDDEIMASILGHKKRSREKTMFISLEKLSELLFLHFLLNSREERASSKSLPAVKVDPTPEQLMFMDVLSDSSLEVEDAPELLAKKLALEKSNPNLPGKLFGAAVFSILNDEDASSCAKKFSINEKELAKAIDSVESIVSGKGRGAEFLGLVKHDGSERDSGADAGRNKKK